MIDTTPPDPFGIEVNISSSKFGFPTLNFEAHDRTSSIDYYSVTIANNKPIKITPNEARLGYTVNKLEDGTYAVTVIAHDKAGNTQKASTVLLVTAGWVKPVATKTAIPILDYLTWLNFLVGFLLAVIVLQFTHFWSVRKQNQLREAKLRRETCEIKDQMQKIFSVLRNEIYDQINRITKRKRLSKKETEAVERLNQTLEIAETLIKKEINDVKSMLK